MSRPISRPAIDLAPPAPARPRLALALALLSLLSVTAASSVAPAGVGAAAIPLALGAIILGLQAPARLNGTNGTRTAAGAVIIAAVTLLALTAQTTADALA